MKVNIQHLKNKFVVEIENLEITIEELKKKLEGVMGESVRIPAAEQTLIFERDKLEDSKKLSDYVKGGGEEIKLFVIKQQRSSNPISKPAGNVYQNASTPSNTQSQPHLGGSQYGGHGQPTPNPYAAFVPPYGGYGSPQQMYGQMPYGGYGSPQQMYGQMPYGGYGSPQQMYGQMPYGYGFPQGGRMPGQGDGYNEAFSNMMIQQMEQMMNNPALLDQALSIQNPNMTPEQREGQKRLLTDALKMMKANPSLFQQALTPEKLSWALGMMNGGGHGEGFPPQMGGFGQNPHAPWMYGQPMPGYASPRPEQVDEQTYLVHLEQLKAMGFEDDEAADALKKARGEINKALDILNEKRNRPADGSSPKN